jgi:hypothetical protein
MEKELKLSALKYNMVRIKIYFLIDSEQVADQLSAYICTFMSYDKILGCHGRDLMIAGFTTTCAYHY